MNTSSPKDILGVALDLAKDPEIMAGAQTAMTWLGSWGRQDEAKPGEVGSSGANPALLASRKIIEALLVPTLQATVPGFSLLQPIVQKQLDEIQKAFPGLSLEHLREGRIPVATAMLEKRLRALVGEREGLKLLCLRSEPGRFLLDLEVDKPGMQSRITVPLTCEAFTYSQEVRSATFTFDEAGVEAEGQNFLGRLLGQLPALLLLKALQGPELAQEMDRASEGMAQLDWPTLHIDLDKCDALHLIRDSHISLPDFGVLGRTFDFLEKLQGQNIGLLDLFSFGPLEIDTDRVWVLVKRVG